jgi:predicted ArsR family transcriptional regulator
VIDDILLALLENDTMTYQQIVDLGIRRQNARARLDNFIHQGLVREDGRDDWKRGKKLLYSLTDNGREECFRLAADNLNEGIKAISTILILMEQNPSRFEEWREKVQTAVQNAAKGEELTLEGKVEQARKIRDTNFGAFRNALKIMHGISLSLFAPRAVMENMSGGVYLHVSENGVIDVLSEDEPIKHPDITIASI